MNMPSCPPLVALEWIIKLRIVLPGEHSFVLSFILVHHFLTSPGSRGWGNLQKKICIKDLVFLRFYKFKKMQILMHSDMIRPQFYVLDLSGHPKATVTGFISLTIVTTIDTVGVCVIHMTQLRGPQYPQV